MTETASTMTSPGPSLPFVRALLEAIDYEDVAQAAVDAIPSELPARTSVVGALLCTVDADAQRLRAFAFTRRPYQGDVERALAGRPLRSFSGDAGGSANLLQRTLSSGRAQTSERLLDFLAEAVDEPAVNAIERSIGWRSGIALPLPVHRRRVGVLLYALGKPFNQLTQAERRKMADLADIVGLALEQARLYEAERRRAREIAALQGVLRRLSTAVDASKVLEEILDAATDLLGADYAAVTTIPSRPGEVSWGMHRGYRSAPTVLASDHRLGTGLVGRAMGTKAPVVVERFGEDPAFPVEAFPVHAAEGMRSGLALPLLRPAEQGGAETTVVGMAVDEQGEAFGALLVGYRRPHEFATAEVDLAASLAQHAAIALERARLFAFESQRAIELEATFQAVDDGIALFDAEARPVRVNEALERLVGMSAERYSRMSVQESTRVLDVRDSTGAPFEPGELPIVRALRGEVVRTTVHLVPAGGQAVQCEVVTSPLRTQHGSATGSAGAVMVIRDVGPELRRRLELEALIATARQLSAAIDQETVLRAIVVAATDTLRCRGAALAVVDREGGDGDEQGEPRLVYREWYQDHAWQLPGQVRQLPEELALRALATGAIQVVNDVDTAASDGTAADTGITQHGEQLGVLALPVYLRGVALAVVVLSGKRDGRSFDDDDLRVLRAFSEQAASALENARLYEQERLARQEIQEAQEQREAFIAAIAHDLKSPLTNVLGHGQLLERYLRKEATAGHTVQASLDRAMQSMHRIADNARRMQGMVEDLQEALRLGSGRFELHRVDCDLVQLAQQVAHEQQAVTERHTLTVTATQKSVVGRWDVERLRQVLVNLVSNAVKYSPDGGAVQIGVRKRKDVAVVTVTDQGMGLLPEDLPVIFQPYSRLHRSRGIKGTGLGLFIVKGIVEAHGGTVRARSTGPGSGTTFSVALPVSLPDQEDTEPRP